MHEFATLHLKFLCNVKNVVSNRFRMESVMSLFSKPFPIYCFKKRQNPQFSVLIKNDLKSCFLQKFREKVLISLHHVPKTKHQTRVDSVILTMVFIGYRNRVHIFGRDRNDDRKGQCPTIKLKPYLDQLSSLETAVCQCVKF